jgi:hypothetical protein
VSMEAKRQAMEALAAKHQNSRLHTNNATTHLGRLVALFKLLGDLVDLVGIEPTTSSMPWKRAPSCATGPRVAILSR